MVFATALVSQLLLASAALSLPSGRERLDRRIAERRAGSRQSKPANLITSQVVTESGNTTHPEFSTNWSGAVLVANSATYRSVTGTFTVPTPREPSGQSGEHAASAWVGIDGDTCQTGILQTGIDFFVSGSTTSFDAWYEFFPDFAHDFTSAPVSPGDSITLTATVATSRSGSVSIVNHSKGWTKTQSLTSTASLCQTNAEWIVEDFEEGNSMVPFANFGTVTFTGASATTISGSTVSVTGADILDIEQNGAVLTDASGSGSTVTVRYTG